MILPILNQNYPNPFNPFTKISYHLPARAHVELEIFDISGNPVTRLVDRVQDDGHYTVEWNGRDRWGEPLATGVYFCRLKADRQTVSRKMILIR